MKIAVPTNNGNVDDHFGHCDHYTIFNVENGKVTSSEKLMSPQGCGCKSNIASTLKNMGVKLMLAGNMGEGAKNKLEGEGINVVRGCSGDVAELVNDWVDGMVSDSGVGCSAHADGHICGNH